MPAIFQQDKAEVVYGLGEGDPDAVGGVGVVVAVDGYHRAFDAFSHLQKSSATPESGGLDVRLSPYYYSNVESLTWPGSGDGKLEGIRASGFALPSGPKRFHIALGNAMVAVLSKGNEIESVHWQGGDPFNVTVDGAADRLTFFHTRQEEDRFAVEVIPLRPEDLNPPLAPGSPY